MPKPGYTSLTLKDAAAELIQMHGAQHPKGQSGLVKDLIGFMAENRRAFNEYVKTKIKAGD